MGVSVQQRARRWETQGVWLVVLPWLTTPVMMRSYIWVASAHAAAKVGVTYGL